MKDFFKIFFTCILFIFSTTIFSQEDGSQSEQLSPRAKYILAFDFIKGEAPSPYPSRKELGISEGLEDMPKITRLTYSDNFILAEELLPYTLQEIEEKEIDLVISRECLGDTVHWPSLNVDPEISDDKLNKLAYKQLADQFSTFINADPELRGIIVHAESLFSTEEDQNLNYVFYEAWKTGRLERPTLMLSGGECSPNWAVFDVEVSFKEKTQRLFGIPTGDFKLCELDGVDPWNLMKCNGVQEILLSGKTKNLQLFGRYLFKVITNDGTESIVGPVVINSDEEISF